MTKILLGISLAAFVIGFADILWGLGRPIGAVFFGLFLISKLLEKETALFDEEHHLRIALAEKDQACAPDRAKGPSRAGPEQRAFGTAAHSH